MRSVVRVGSVSINVSMYSGDEAVYKLVVVRSLNVKDHLILIYIFIYIFIFFLRGTTAKVP
jgi:hypothetical protein